MLPQEVRPGLGKHAASCSSYDDPSTDGRIQDVVDEAMTHRPQDVGGVGVDLNMPGLDVKDAAWGSTPLPADVRQVADKVQDTASRTLPRRSADVGGIGIECTPMDRVNEIGVEVRPSPPPPGMDKPIDMEMDRSAGQVHGIEADIVPPEDATRVGRGAEGAIPKISLEKEEENTTPKIGIVRKALTSTDVILAEKDRATLEEGFLYIEGVVQQMSPGAKEIVVHLERTFVSFKCANGVYRLRTLREWVATYPDQEEKMIAAFKKMRTGAERGGKHGAWVHELNQDTAPSVYGKQLLCTNMRVLSDLPRRHFKDIVGSVHGIGTIGKLAERDGENTVLLRQATADALFIRVQERLGKKLESQKEVLETLEKEHRKLQKGDTNADLEMRLEALRKEQQTLATRMAEMDNVDRFAYLIAAAHQDPASMSRDPLNHAKDTLVAVKDTILEGQATQHIEMNDQDKQDVETYAHHIATSLLYNINDHDAFWLRHGCTTAPLRQHTLPNLLLRALYLAGGKESLGPADLNALTPDKTEQAILADSYLAAVRVKKSAHTALTEDPDATTTANKVALVAKCVPVKTVRIVPTMKKKFKSGIAHILDYPRRLFS